MKSRGAVLRYLFVILCFFMSMSLHATEWPPGLAQSTFNRCDAVGGGEQCRCVVIRLQHKYTLEDMKLSMTNKLAKEALTQMIRALTVKCLGKEFKEETFAMKNHHSPEKNNAHRFR